MLGLKWVSYFSSDCPKGTFRRTLVTQDLLWQNLINEKTHKKECLENIHLDFDSFMKLTDMIRVFVTPNPKAFKKDVILAKKQVVLVLYYLKGQGSLRMTANTFGVSISLVLKNLKKWFPSTEEEPEKAASSLKFA